MSGKTRMEQAEKDFKRDCEGFRVWHSTTRCPSQEDIDFHVRRLRRQAIELGYIQLNQKG